MLSSIIAYFVAGMFYIITPIMFLLSLVILIKQDWK